MKLFIIINLFLFTLSCALTSKPDFQSVVTPPPKTRQEGRLLSELRELAQTGEVLISKESFEFISTKFKTIISRYNFLKKKVSQLESRIDKLTKKGQEKQKQVNKNIHLEPVTVDMDDSLLDDLKEEMFKTQDEKQETQDEKQETQDEKRTPSFTEAESLFKQAEKMYNEQNWESAIAKFEEYRRATFKTHEEGYRKATFYIGRSFKNLKLEEEAKVFFNELIRTYPQSEEAKKAQDLLIK